MTANSGGRLPPAVPKSTVAREAGAGSGPASWKFLVVSGCNGVGKSTVARALSDRLAAVVFHYPPEFVRFREEVSLDAKVSALPRLLYYLGATLHLSDLVRNQLARGHVICDRYLESPVSLLLAESAFTEDDLDRICAPFRPYLRVPDLTLFLTASYETARARIHRRLPDNLTRVQQAVLDSPEFFHNRQTRLRAQAARLGPVLELDSTALSEADMCRAAWSLVAAALGCR